MLYLFTKAPNQISALFAIIIWYTTINNLSIIIKIRHFTFMLENL